MANITLLRPAPVDEPEPVARPRVVLGLDDFGRDVLRTLPQAFGTVVATDIVDWANVDALLDAALADPAWNDLPAIEPVLVAIADLGGAAAGAIAQGLAGVIARTLETQISLSALVVLRLLERGPERADAEHVISQMRELVDVLLAPGQPGHGRVTVVLIPNRDGAGHVYQSEECVAKTRHLLSLLLDQRLGDDPRLRRCLAPLPTGFGEASDPWAWTAAFAAVDLRRFVYPSAEVAATRRTALVAWLRPALLTPPPASWEPGAPTLGKVGAELETRFPHPGLPHWEPDLWRPVDDEIGRARSAVANWIARAHEWTEEQRIRVTSRRLALADEGSSALNAFRQRSSADLVALLRDEALPGLWLPWQRWLAAALATIGDPPPLPSLPAAPPPPAIAEQRFLTAIARRANARAVVVAATLLLVLGASLILAAAQTHAIVPAVAPALATALALLPLPAPGSVCALAALALVTALVSWLVILTARLRLEHAWDRDVHAPAVRWSIAAVAHHRATLLAHAAHVQSDLARQARDDLLAIERRANALRDAFASAAADPDAAVDADDAGDRFTRRIDPTPLPPPAGDPHAVLRVMRAHPDLAPWLASGSATGAASLRDRLLAVVDDASEPGLTDDPRALARVIAHLAQRQ